MIVHSPPTSCALHSAVDGLSEDRWSGQHSALHGFDLSAFRKPNLACSAVAAKHCTQSQTPGCRKPCLSLSDQSRTVSTNDYGVCVLQKVGRLCHEKNIEHYIFRLRCLLSFPHCNVHAGSWSFTPAGVRNPFTSK
eukprot:scpid79409/ scgid9161/ 